VDGTRSTRASQVSSCCDPCAQASTRKVSGQLRVRRNRIGACTTPASCRSGRPIRVGVSAGWSGALRQASGVAARTTVMDSSAELAGTDESATKEVAKCPRLRLPTSAVTSAMRSYQLDWGPGGDGAHDWYMCGLGVQLVARHGRMQPGFIDPEVCYNPDEFLAELRRRGSVAVAWTDSPLNGRRVGRKRPEEGGRNAEALHRRRVRREHVKQRH
jgi:hypothetical protein